MSIIANVSQFKCISKGAVTVRPREFAPSGNQTAPAGAFSKSDAARLSIEAEI